MTFDTLEQSMSTLFELFDFLRKRKKVWLLPIFLILFLTVGLVILSEGYVISPFIYTLF